MRRFLTRIGLFIAIPLSMLAILFVATDPYKVLKPFSLDYFDITNRDYLSSELFLLNYPEQKYDSYIFGSSRGCGINTYHWAKYLPNDSKPFLFQGWSETLTGIEQKIDYIDKSGYELNNAIVLIDIPGTFDLNQRPKDALSIKDPSISGQPKWIHRLILFYDFIQKPSQWVSAAKRYAKPLPIEISFDIVSNDWDANNKYRDLSVPPKKDSLKNMSSISRNAFLKEIADKTDADVKRSASLITGHFIKQLVHIKEIFDKKGTNYRILITPGFCFTSYAISSEDLSFLRQLFGARNVFDFSGKNVLSADYNNYSDSGHFGQYVGWYMIEEMYNESCIPVREH